MSRNVVVLDGATLTAPAVARVARGGAPVELAAEAARRNEAARVTLAAVLERGEPIYGVSTGVGSLREYPVHEDPSIYSLRLLRSHACGAGRVVPLELVRAAMAVRANQLGAGGAGVAEELLDTLVALLNAGLSPFTRELGSLGTGDLTALADIGLALLGEGQIWRGERLLDAGQALADAAIPPARLGPRDGLAFISSNAVTVGHAALLVVDVHRMFDAWPLGAAPTRAVSRGREDARAPCGVGAPHSRSWPDGRSGSLPVPRASAGRRCGPRSTHGARGDRGA
jgi:histidine ammonia-lyase